VKLVVDANILFSALIRDGHTRKLFFKDGLELYAPEYLFDEFGKYEDEILEKTRRSRRELSMALAIMRDRVTIVPTVTFKKFMKNALKISPDESDAAYFAVALAINGSMWSNDKLLKTQNAIRVFSTAEITGLFGR
jgi:predicted nucleic acid-binding protein